MIDTHSVIIADMGEIYARIMDHRPVLQAEIQFTLREFEVGKNK